MLAKGIAQSYRTYFDPTSNTVTSASFEIDSIARTERTPSHPAPMIKYFVMLVILLVSDGKMCSLKSTPYA